MYHCIITKSSAQLYSFFITKMRMQCSVPWYIIVNGKHIANIFLVVKLFNRTSANHP